MSDFEENKIPAKKRVLTMQEQQTIAEIKREESKLLNLFSDPLLIVVRRRLELALDEK